MRAHIKWYLTLHQELLFDNEKLQLFKSPTFKCLMVKHCSFMTFMKILFCQFQIHYNITQT